MLRTASNINTSSVLISIIQQGAYNVMYVPGEGKMAHGEKMSEIKLGEKGAVCTEGKGPNWHCEFKVTILSSMMAIPVF